MEEGDTLVNGLIGAVVAIVAGSFLPLGPLLGGAVAGYLEGGERADGVRVGAIAGVVALVLGVLFGLLILAVVGFAFAGMGVPAVSGAFVVVAGFFVLVVGTLYFVGLAALGGWLGNYVKYDTDLF